MEYCIAKIMNRTAVTVDWKYLATGQAWNITNTEGRKGLPKSCRVLRSAKQWQSPLLHCTTHSPAHHLGEGLRRIAWCISFGEYFATSKLVCAMRHQSATNVYYSQCRARVWDKATCYSSRVPRPCSPGRRLKIETSIANLNRQSNRPELP